MEELNKTQLILLALLVSFVTSIATGIVTVALMDQAPPYITQTISRVIKETERIIVPAKGQYASVETIVVKEEDYIVNAVDSNMSNIVTVAVLEKRKSRLGFTNPDDSKRNIVPIGTGFALTESGVIVFPRTILERNSELVIITRAGNHFSINIINNDDESGLVFVKTGAYLSVEEEIDSDVVVTIDLSQENKEKPPKLDFITANFAVSSEIKLGQTAIALGLIDGRARISLGTITGFGVTENNEVALVYTTIMSNSNFNGSPLLSSSSKVAGIFLTDSSGGLSAVSSEVVKALLDEVITDIDKKKNGTSTEN